MKTIFPEPKVGYYYAECCMIDLTRIDNEDDLNDVKERIQHNHECGELMIFSTYEDALTYLDKC